MRAKYVQDCMRRNNFRRIAEVQGIRRRRLRRLDYEHPRHDGAGGASIYAASQHAVEGLTKSAALEVAGLGIRVNAVAPGPIETAMLNRFTGNAERKAGLVSSVPLGRVGSPMRSPTPSFSLPPTRRPLLPATYFPSMAGSRQGGAQTRQ